MSGNYFIIFTENIDATQRRQLQSLVKRKGKNWWHEFVDVWIVEGGDIRQWTQDVNIIINGEKHDHAVILALPPDSLRSVGSIMPPEKRAWLSDVFAPKNRLTTRAAKDEISAKSPDEKEEEPPF